MQHLLHKVLSSTPCTVFASIAASHGTHMLFDGCVLNLPACTGNVHLLSDDDFCFYFYSKFYNKKKKKIQYCRPGFCATAKSYSKMAILFTFHHVYWPPLPKQIVLGTATVLYSLHCIFQQLVDLTWAANEVVSTKSKELIDLTQQLVSIFFMWTWEWYLFWEENMLLCKGVHRVPDEC